MSQAKKELEYDVFISYSRKDSETAEKIFTSLTGAGLRCFIDRGISGGADFPAVLAQSILASRMLLFVASRHSYASEYTQKELTFALHQRRPIFPLIIDGSELPPQLHFLLSNINWRELSSHYAIEQELVTDVKKKLDDPGQPDLPSTFLPKKGAKRSWLPLLAVVVLLLALAGWWLSREWGQRQQEREKQRMESLAGRAGDQLSQAQAALVRLEDLISRGDTNNAEEEVDLLNQADSLLTLAESQVGMYREDLAYGYLFAPVATGPARDRVESLREWMCSFWKEKALSSYESYQALELESFHKMAVRFVTVALSLQPEDAELQSVRAALSE